MQALTPNIYNVHLIIRERFGFILPERKSAENISLLARSSLNRRRKESKLEQRERLRKSKEFDALVKWITKVQKDLRLDDYEYAKRLGLKSRRMLLHYRGKKGHVPSRKVLVKVLELERISQIRISRSN